MSKLKSSSQYHPKIEHGTDKLQTTSTSLAQFTLRGSGSFETKY